jgi:uncharacterized spore protein YtfJ
MDGQAIRSIIDDITHTVQTQGNIRAVFGEPVQFETHKIIPVATIDIGLRGAGAAAGPAGGAHTGLVDRIAEFSRRLIPFGAGGGIGGAIKVKPIGFLHEVDGKVIFSKIG